MAMKKPVLSARCFVETSPGELVSAAKTSDLFYKMLQRGYSSLESRWAVFFSAWNVPYQTTQSTHFSLQFEKSKYPSFFLPSHRVWISIQPLSEFVSFEDWIDYYAPMTWETKQPVLILFGPPRLRMPSPQGWMLRWQDGELVSAPIHLSECPSCGGFDAVCVEEDEEQQAKPALLTLMRQRIDAPRLKAAYDTANDTRFLLH